MTWLTFIWIPLNPICDDYTQVTEEGVGVQSYLGNGQINDALYIKGLYKGASLVAFLQMSVRNIVFADNSEFAIALHKTPEGPVLEINRGPPILTFSTFF